MPLGLSQWRAARPTNFLKHRWLVTLAGTVAAIGGRAASIGQRRASASAGRRTFAAALQAEAGRRSRARRRMPADVRIEKILFLGTSSAVPVPGKRNMSSLAVLLSTGSAILVDCGEGTQHHIRVSTILKASRISAILLTHLHGDHCFGIFGLLNSIAMEGRSEPLLIVGPEGVQGMVQMVLQCSGGWSPDSFELQFLEIPNCGVQGREDLVGPDGYGPLRQGFNPDRCARAEPVPLGVHSGLTLQAVPLVHGLPDWGYLLTEPDRPGSLDAARALELGVPARSPLLGKLKRGQPVSLPDGSTVVPEQVVGPPVRGRTIAVLQDTCDSTAAIAPCKDAACVIHEATFEQAMEKDAWDKGHSTSTMAAKFAAACSAQRLVLTHFSARYSTSDAAATETGDPADLLGEEARRVLGEGTPVVVAKDFLVLRGDRNFEPELRLAAKHQPWQPLLGAAGGPDGLGNQDIEMARCC